MQAHSHVYSHRPARLNAHTHAHTHARLHRRGDLRERWWGWRKPGNSHVKLSRQPGRGRAERGLKPGLPRKPDVQARTRGKALRSPVTKHTGSQRHGVSAVGRWPCGMGWQAAGRGGDGSGGPGAHPELTPSPPPGDGAVLSIRSRLGGRSGPGGHPRPGGPVTVVSAWPLGAPRSRSSHLPLLSGEREPSVRASAAPASGPRPPRAGWGKGFVFPP